MNSKFYHSLGLKIRAIRMLKNFTQEHMAERLYLSTKSYRKYENGQAQIRMERLTEIAAIFELKLEELLRFDPDQALRGGVNTQSGS